MRNLIPLLLLLTSCNYPLKDLLYDLYRQRIPNSSLVIYQFEYEGMFATTSAFTGYTVLDSTIVFSGDKIDKLPCTYFSSPPSKSRFSMIDLDHGQSPRTPADTLLTPVGLRTIKVKGIEIAITKYNDTYGDAVNVTGLKEYKFDSLKESQDSLTFYNLTDNSGNVQLPSTISFAKGNIKIIDSVETIMRIEIDQFVDTRGPVYTPVSRILVPNQPIVDMATYFMRPRKCIKVNALSDYGIFKRII